MKSKYAIGLVAGLGLSLSVVAVGCASKKQRNVIDESATEPPVGFGDAGDGRAACTNLECQQTVCTGGDDTTVTGTVYAPNGTLPLYNAIVYVPNSELDPAKHGVTCDTCGAVTGAPLVTALSDATGAFELKNVPVGKDIPLVIQIGKWRRKVTIPEVKACKENRLKDHDLTRLPKNQSEGDMPQIALTSGGCDNFGCMLPKIGIDPSEFGTESDGPAKAVHVYLGSGGAGPAGATQASSLWNNLPKLMNYDMALFSCECSESLTNKGSIAFGAVTDYLKGGGRIFTTDFMYTWYKMSPDPDLQTIGSIRGGAPYGSSPMTVDKSFPKGQALSEWLASAASVSGGQITTDATFSNFMSVDPAKAQQWATSAPGDNGGKGPRVMTVNVPVGVSADKQCGKGVHIDAHVNQTGGDVVGTSYPSSCTLPMKAGESLLAFFFFDLASCIQNDQEAPKPPVVK